jgi:acid phosphatase (class A)
MFIVCDSRLSMKSIAPDSNSRQSRRGCALLLCLLFLAAPPLLAESHYLPAGRPDGVALLPPPPAPGSAEEAADLLAARAVFNGRTEAEKDHAFKTASLSIFLYAPAIGPCFEPGKFPKTELLFQKVRKDISEPLDRTKKYWKRLRPYELDPQLNLGRPETSYGYPSGHSTRGTVQALLLAELFPQRREGILAIGRQIGWDRVLIGKHFPADIHAARVLGQAIARELLASPAFQRDLAEAKAEVRACAETSQNGPNPGLRSDAAQLPSTVPALESERK